MGQRLFKVSSDKTSRGLEGTRGARPANPTGCLAQSRDTLGLRSPEFSRLALGVARLMLSECQESFHPWGMLLPPQSLAGGEGPWQAGGGTVTGGQAVGVGGAGRTSQDHQRWFWASPEVRV